MSSATAARGTTNGSVASAEDRGLHPRLAGALVFAVALLAWVSSLGVGFLTDDFEMLARVRGATPAELWSFLWRPAPSSLRPLYVAAFAFDLRLWGLEPAGFHLTNVLVHAVNAVLVLRLGGALGLPRPAALAGALFFALDPLAIGAVAWISGRADVMAAAFVLGSTLAFLQFAETRHAGPLCTAFVLCACGLLTKETGAVAAAWALLVALERRRPGLLGGCGALLLIVAGYLAYRRAVIGDLSPTADYLSFPPPAVALGLLGAGTRIAFPLSDAVLHAPLLRPLAAVILGLLVVWGLRRARGEWRRILLLGGCLAAAWALVLPMLAGLPTLYDSRHQYLPAVPVCLLLGIALNGWRRGRTRRVAEVAGPLLALLWLIFLTANVRHWRRNGTLVREVVDAVAAAAAPLAPGTHLAVSGCPDMKDGYFPFHGNRIGTATHLLHLDTAAVAIDCVGSYACPEEVAAGTLVRIDVTGWSVRGWSLSNTGHP